MSKGTGGHKMNRGITAAQNPPGVMSERASYCVYVILPIQQSY